MKNFAEDGNNDLYVGVNGRLSISDGLQAVATACEQAAETMAGEMVFAINQGLPNFAAVWVGAPNIPQFEAALRRALLAVPKVVSVQSITTTVGNNKLSYTAVIATEYGETAING